MNCGVPEPAEVLREHIEIALRVRHATSIDVDADTLDLVEQRLDGQRAALSTFWAASLGAREGANFLRYDEGGFYRPHRDRAVIASWPDAARRRIAVVVFLNSSREVDGSGTFTGGTLRLFHEVDKNQAIDIVPRAGTLIAFRATVLHEVTVVQNGTRDTVVDWFY